MSSATKQQEEVSSVWSDPSGVTPEVVAWKDLKAGAPGLVASFVFAEELNVALDKPDQGLDTLRVGSFRATVNPPESGELVGYKSDVRFWVQKSKGARVAVIADLGGTTHTMDFPYDEELDASLTRTFFSLEPRNEKKSNPTQPPVPPYVATFVVAIQRRTIDDRAAVQIDTMDVRMTIVEK